MARGGRGSVSCPSICWPRRASAAHLQPRGQAAAARCALARCLPVSAATGRFVSDCTGGPLMSSVLVVPRDMIVSVFHARAWTVVRGCIHHYGASSNERDTRECANLLWAQGC